MRKSVVFLPFVVLFAVIYWLHDPGDRYKGPDGFGLKSSTYETYEG